MRRNEAQDPSRESPSLVLVDDTLTPFYSLYIRFVRKSFLFHSQVSFPFFGVSGILSTSFCLLNTVQYKEVPFPLWFLVSVVRKGSGFL